MAKLFDTNFDPRYRWRPQYPGDHCRKHTTPVCDHCGVGHYNYDPINFIKEDSSVPLILRRRCGIGVP